MVRINKGIFSMSFPRNYGRWLSACCLVLAGCGQSKANPSASQSSGSAHSSLQTSEGKSPRDSSLNNGGGAVRKAAPVVAQFHQDSVSDDFIPLTEVFPTLFLSNSYRIPFAIHPTKTSAFVTIGPNVMLVKGDSLVFSELLQLGNTKYAKNNRRYESYRIDAIGGEFPENVWMRISQPMTRRVTGELWHWESQAWKPDLSAYYGPATVDAMVPLAGESLLFVGSKSRVKDNKMIPGPSYQLNVWYRGSGPAGAQHPILQGRSNVDSWSVLPDGSVWVFYEGKLVGWNPKGDLLAVESQPSVPKDLIHQQIVALQSNEIYALFTAPEPGQTMSKNNRLLRFDGHSWHDETAANRAVDRLFRGPNKSLWATVGDSTNVWVRSHTGMWKEHVNVNKPDSLWVSPDGHVWATAHQGRMLLRSGTVKSKQKMYDLVAKIQPGVYNEGCPVVAVNLLELPKTGNGKESFQKIIDEIFPLSEKWNTKVSILDVVEKGERNLYVYWNEQLTKTSREEAEKQAKSLMDRVGMQMPGSKPQLKCLRLPHHDIQTRVLKGPAVPTESHGNH
jgi:hypothetical protein